ncbi:hypothetical protein pkur_cds_280 [Pandoravirus kuranda]|uniref:Uncharacterized protein n=1 Tax=Pandoravirus kuranda TaxID=3019033 RepID=A0AA95EEG5_9VIRU|nr:hypothetical protein pkur_cds_280 [Pandoravirus kuranda]
MDDNASDRVWRASISPPAAGTDTPSTVAGSAKLEPLDEIERMLFEPEPLPSNGVLEGGDYGALFDALRSAQPHALGSASSSACHVAPMPFGARDAPPASVPIQPTACSGANDAKGGNDGDDNDGGNNNGGDYGDYGDDDDEDSDGDAKDDSETHGLGVVAALDAKYGSGSTEHATSAMPSSSSSPPPSLSSPSLSLPHSIPRQTTPRQDHQHAPGDRGRSDGTRRTSPPKTKYRDAPVPLEGRAYNPVRFQYDGNIFEYPARPPSGEYREFSGHAEENATTPPHLFAVYVIDDTERKKGATKRCLLHRDRVRDIVWSLPERRDANGRTLHGVPPTPQDQYDVRIDPSVAGLPMSSVPVHNRTRVFLTVRNPPPIEPLIGFTVGPVPDPARTDPFDFIRGQLASLGTPDAAAVVTTRGESLDMLVAKHDLVNLDQEVSLAVPARHMLGVRSGLVARGLLVKDKMFRERALRIGPMAPALLKREAVGLVDRCRAAGLSDNQIVLSAEMPLRTYVILRLCDLGSELYGEDYLADERFRNMFKDRGPAHLSPPQTVQLSDAFYWVYLAPEDQRRPEFEEVIRFYQQRGVEVRLKKPHVKSGSSVGRTSESGALRHFKPHSKATHSLLRSRYEIVAPSGEVQALRTVKPRAKTLSPSERNPAAARLDRAAAEAARRPRAFGQPGASDSAGARLGCTGIARFLKPTAAVKVETTAPSPSTAMPPTGGVAPPACRDARDLAGGALPVVGDHNNTGAYGQCPKPVVVAAGVLDRDDRKKPTAPVEPFGALFGDIGVDHSAGPSKGSSAKTMPQETRIGAPDGASGTMTAPTTLERSSHQMSPADSREVDRAVAAAVVEDLLSLHRKAIAFPDPVIVGAPPEGMVESVLTWASVRDKIPEPALHQPLSDAASTTTTATSSPSTSKTSTSSASSSKAPREKKKKGKTTTKSAKKERSTHGKSEKRSKKQSKRHAKKQAKKQAKKVAAGSEREANQGERRLGKRQRDAPARAGGAQPMALPPPVDAAALLRLLPRQGEPLFLPIVHLLPPDGTSAMPGFGAPYVRLPCPVPAPTHGPVRVLLQQLPLVLPTTNLRQAAPVAMGSTPEPPVPQQQQQQQYHHQYQPPLPPPSAPAQPPLSQQQQRQDREEQPGNLAAAAHNSDADWLNLLSAIDTDV